MHLSEIDGVLWAISLLGEFLLIGVLFRRNLISTFPLLTVYIASNLLEDPVAYWVLNHTSSTTYFRFYFATTVLDYVLQFLVLTEIALIVLRPVRRSLPPGAVSVLLAMIVVGGSLSYFLAPIAGSPRAGQITVLFLHLTFWLAILRLVVFALIAGFAQMLGIGWKNHVLQLTTGLAFFGAVNLLIQLTMSRLTTQHHLDAAAAPLQALTELQTGAYIGTLVFWSWAFSQNEAPRKEFTPQMQAVLVTIAGTTRRTRLAVTRNQGTK